MTAAALLSVPCRRSAHPNCQSIACECGCHVKNRKPKSAPVIALVWEEPPERDHTTKRLDDRVGKLIVELRRNPERWAKLLVYRSKAGADGAVKRLRPVFPDIEMVARKTQDASAVYARFMGECEKD